MTSVPPSSSGHSERLGTIVLIAILVPFLIVSLATAFLAVRSLLEEDFGKGAFLAIFSLAFGGGALAMLAFMVAGRRRARRVRALRAGHPDEPWMWRDDWASGIARSNSRNTMLFAWGFAILWNLISTPLIFVLLPEILERENYAALLGLLFPLVGLGLLTWAIRQAVEWRKFGQSVFHMTTLPGVIGGTLEGSVDVPAHFDPGQDFDLTLSAINRKTTGAGKSTSTTEAVLWQEKSAGVKSYVQPGEMGAGIPVRFSIPFDCAQTDDKDSRNVVLWRLETHAAVPGLDYTAQFEIPVFRTAASRPDAGGKIPGEELPDGYQPGEDAGISVGVGPTGETEIVVHPRWRVVPLVSTVVFFAVWTGVIAVIIHFDAPAILPVVFGLFDVLLLFIILQLAFGYSRILCGSGSVKVMNGIGPWASTTTIRREDIVRIAPSIAMQSGKTVMYSVTILRKSRKRAVMRVLLKEKHDAVWLADKIMATA